MRQYEAVIEVMRASGGYATLGYLYGAVLKVPGVKWGTKTPFASIRRIVQDPRFFFRIRPGLWALNDYKDRLPFPVEQKSTGGKEFTHTYYQGLIVEIGNLEKYKTAVPDQDKNKTFLGRRLADVVTAEEYYPFSYKHFVSRARTIDVTWFNERLMPSKFFEVEHTTSMENALLKFVELQDFSSGFAIVADKTRSAEFRSRLSYSAFAAVRNRVKFLDYETLSGIHSHTFELASLQATL